MFLATKRFDPDIADKIESKERKIKKAKVENDDKTRNGSTTELEKNEVGDSAVEVSEQVELEIDPKHAGLLTKFKSIFNKVTGSQNSSSEKNSMEESEDDDVIKQAPVESDLVPLPQPKPVFNAKSLVSEIPKWMAKPHFIPLDATCSFEEFNLSPIVLKNLSDLGFTRAFAVQTQVIKQLMRDISDSISPDKKKDILVNSFTGSGKTLAYSVPIVEALRKRVVPRIRVLIILPTKPLIQQVRGVVESLSKGTSMRTLALRTDRPFPEEQKLILSHTPDIIISTPGRLVDHIQNTKGFTLEFLQYVVIDEADRLLNQSYQEWVSILMASIPETPLPPQRPVQKLIFSATLTRDPGKLSSLNITSHSQIFIVGDKPDMELEFSLPKTLTERVVNLKSTTNKPLVLLRVLQHFGLLENTIIFAKSNEAVARLSRIIALIDEEVFHTNLKVDKCSGEMDVAYRRKKLRQFADGEIGILVCTDLIARGIDISTVQTVINYDLPIGKREYVHRVGRTARAGANGTAWSFITGKGEKRHFWHMADSIFRSSEIEQVEAKSLIDDKELEKEQNEGYQRSLGRLEEEVFQ